MNKFRLGCILVSTGVGATVVVPPVVVAAIENGEEVVCYRDININKDWTFRLNDESQEQIIDLPHDFSIIQNFRHSERDLSHQQTSGSTGFLPGGTGYYHKEFVLPKKDNPTVVLKFDGAYNDTLVTVNGQIVGNNKYGYNPFAFDISKYVKADGITVNKLDVVVKHEFVTSSRWYPGSGIYRDVNISVLDKLHVAHNGTYVTTPYLKEEVGQDVTVNMEVEVDNDYDTDQAVYVKNRVVDAQGNIVCGWVSSEGKKIDHHSSRTFNTQLKVNNPKLWSDKTPNLYYVETQVVSQGHVHDEYKTRFGFRYYEFDDQGFKINGDLIKLHGVCLHHDQGALGAAAYNDAMYRQLCIMKEMGMNAIRTSHNCPDEDLLRMCDELGLYVMDEAFDGWRFSKTNQDFGEMWDGEIGVGNKLIDATSDMKWHSFVMRSMVKRDRNCPSIFMWSLGNELHEGAWHDKDITEEQRQAIMKQLLGYGKELKEIARELDHDSNTKRWCGIALESNPNTGQDPKKDESGFPKCQIALELFKDKGLMGFNYQDASVTENALKQLGERVYGSETASAQNSRGYYGAITFDSAKDKHEEHFRVPSYDIYGTHVASEAIWRTLYFDGYGGQFVWTGFDYIGEPSPYCWNCEDDPVSQIDKWPYPNSSYFGIVDTCGFPKDSYYLYRANIRHDDTTLHLVGSLNEDNMYKYPAGDAAEGFTPVDIYSNAPYILIKRNGSEIATITRSEAETSRRIGTYHVYKDEDINITDSENCKVITLPDSSHDLYKRLAINPTGTETITAEAYEDAQFTKPIANTKGLSQLKQINSASKKISWSVDKPVIKADGKSLAYVTVDLIDDDGDLITDYDSQIDVNVIWHGAGQVLGVDNGDQQTDKKFQCPDIYKIDGQNHAIIKTYAGKALIIVCSDTTPGKITLNINGNIVEIKTQ